MPGDVGWAVIDYIRNGRPTPALRAACRDHVPGRAVPPPRPRARAPVHLPVSTGRLPAITSGIIPAAVTGRLRAVLLRLPPEHHLLRTPSLHFRILTPDLQKDSSPLHIPFTALWDHG